MSQRYSYCGCGEVFHPAAQAEFTRHVGETGHPPLTVAQVDRYIDRICQVCRRARGVKAFGFFQLTAKSLPMYSWVCKRCLAELVGAAQSA